ncbi:methyl-accepting chemotaxis protein [Marinobacterium sediminicola]|uniref:Aerotaxis receptor n=1 Tax=Marinobacterium sediminicola TaxID=518898 RepID=A0ABY1RW30_9GAMM|nr:PAS domain-containing methyl-accepting chemotaxis protein [Marinobacterium sediminicola]ULG70452.1 methyl-accepting chemotaxis protein [Marinobacterium sediminicola]SMR69295.1 aerotaxis receptor [Marinobacterium sediminicola]
MNNKKKPSTHHNELILVTSPTGEIREASSALLTLCGYSAHEIESSKLQNLRHPDMPEGPMKDLWQTIAAKQPWMGMLQLKSSNGSPVWLDAYVIPLVDNGRIIECQCIFRHPSDEAIERAAEIYRLRRQGKTPRALRWKTPTLERRVQLAGTLALLPIAIFMLMGTESQPTAFVALFLSWLFGLLCTHWLCRPLNQLIGYSRTLVSHPIKQMIYTGTHDDIGQLQLAIHLLQSQLEAVLTRMQYSSDEVMSGAVETVKVMNSTCEEIQQQQDSLVQVASAMSQINSTIEEMSASTAQTAMQTQQAQDSLRQGQEVVSQAVASIRSLDASITSTTERVSDLQQHSNTIGTITQVIGDIAEQTNLLALNAAIEAARAGENGRGFAVVADEVRQLAQRTQQSTSEIQKMIAALQQQTDAIVSAMHAKRSLSGQGVDHIETAGRTLLEVLHAIEQISDMATQLASASEEQNSVTHEVGQRIQLLSDGAGRTVEGASMTLELNNRAAQLAERQRSLVSCIQQA